MKIGKDFHFQPIFTLAGNNLTKCPHNLSQNAIVLHFQKHNDKSSLNHEKTLLSNAFFHCEKQFSKMFLKFSQNDAVFHVQEVQKKINTERNDVVFVKHKEKRRSFCISHDFSQY